MSYAKYTTKRITKKQRAFIEMYVYEDLNQSQCAFRAGYKHPEIIANRLLHNPNYKHVQDKVKALQAKQRQRYEIKDSALDTLLHALEFTCRVVDMPPIPFASLPSTIKRTIVATCSFGNPSNIDPFATEERFEPAQ